MLSTPTTGVVIRKSATMPPAANARLPVNEAISRPIGREQNRPQQAVGPAGNQGAGLVPDPAQAGLDGERRGQEDDQLGHAEEQADRG